MRRYIKIAIALLSLGVTPVVIRASLEASGLTADEARDVVRKARNADEREADPGRPDIYKHRRVIFCRTADEAACETVVANALCADLVDAGPGHGDCVGREVQWFDSGRAVCNAAMNEIGRMGELSLRDRDRDDLAAAEDAEQALSRSFRSFTLAQWSAKMVEQTWSLCP